MKRQPSEEYHFRIKAQNAQNDNVCNVYEHNRFHFWIESRLIGQVVRLIGKSSLICEDSIIAAGRQVKYWSIIIAMNQRTLIFYLISLLATDHISFNICRPINSTAVAKYHRFDPYRITQYTYYRPTVTVNIK